MYSLYSGALVLFESDIFVMFIMRNVSQVALAEKHKAKGVILFSDPADITIGNTSDVYPHSWWYPATGTQRGSLLIGDGDPLSADYPAISMA